MCSCSQNIGLLPLVSLHIRSMWETICDAWTCWIGWNFGPNSTEYPYSEIQFQNTPPGKLKFGQILALWLFSFRIPPPPPPENWNLGRSWHFKTFQFQNTPPPENWNLGRSWHFKTFQFQNTPPKKNWNLGRSWHFKTFQFQNTAPPPPRKLKFGQILPLWLFSFRIPPWKLKFGQILALWLFSFRIPPAPPNWNLGRFWHFKTSVSEYPSPQKNWNLGRSWHFKTFQFQNYVWQVTTCGDFIQPG